MVVITCILPESVNIKLLAAEVNRQNVAETEVREAVPSRLTRWEGFKLTLASKLRKQPHSLKSLSNVDSQCYLSAPS